MDRMLLRTFQRHVLDQCEFMLLAANEINAGLAANDFNLVFFGLQNFLNAGANVSKGLWGQKGKHANKRKPLRDSIGVADDSPLRDPDMRNHFEHFDERLDKWWAESANHVFIDRNIAPKGMILANAAPIEWFRAFDPQTTDVYFWSEEFNLQQLVNEVHKILPKLREEANKPHWEQ